MCKFDKVVRLQDFFFCCPEFDGVPSFVAGLYREESFGLLWLLDATGRVL